MKRYYLYFFLLLFGQGLLGQQSVARLWNEVLLEGIRGDQARPVVHARNLFHLSAGMYDCWAAATGEGAPYFLGSSRGGINFPFVPEDLPDYPDKVAAAELAMNVFAFHFLRHRYANSPGREAFYRLTDSLINTMNINPYLINSSDYTREDPAHLGNYLRERIIAFGFEDGANEENDYVNQLYQPKNEAFRVGTYGVSGLLDYNAWQPLGFDVFIDQSGNILDGQIPEFLGAEWGKVVPFALKAEDRQILQKEGEPGDWWVYHDPGPPPFFEEGIGTGAPTSWYRWNFELVAKWSSHLDPDDGVMWDISPGSIGNIGIENYPTVLSDYPTFYDEYEGGDISRGHAINPVTGEPYPENVVPRGDYTRVLAEFWADGPASETPPGHWFAIMNKVMDHPLFERKFKGEGEEMSLLEYDLKAYLVLGGAMHDAAVTAWGIKGYYDYIRPISSVRLLARLGQRSNVNTALGNYNEEGVTLSPGYIEEFTDAADVYGGRTTGNIRYRAWRGNQALENDPELEVAGVDWINAGDWEPYQRPTFVTPNFAGYISGHSTFSSAAAEVLEMLTGDPYFPGGVGEFVAPANEFLVFEKGPSVDVHLQWATYRDASDQTSLSRIWGGIHPPIDDIPGRLIGIEIGQDAFAFAERLFAGEMVCSDLVPQSGLVPRIINNPVRKGDELAFLLDCNDQAVNTIEVIDAAGRVVSQVAVNGQRGSMPSVQLARGVYFLRVVGADKDQVAQLQIW